MNEAKWRRIEDLFLEAVALEPGERLALLDRTHDPEVRLEIEAMLGAHEGGARLRIEDRLLGERTGETGDAPGSLAAGTRIAAYRIDALIGVGGMGEVYRAERVGEYRQTVALKVLRPIRRTTEMVRRFRTEREILARLAHPDIAAILDGGTTGDGRPFLVLQYVEGLPITEHCDRNRLGLTERLQLFRRVAAAVQFAHGHLVVHRDIKPSNILITPQGDPKLLDFGIAKLLEPSGEESARTGTRAELRLLTPEHAAPEQLRGEPVSTATDVYALGVLLFALLTGRRPFPSNGRTPLDLERAILEESAPSPSSVMARPADARRVRGDLDRIVLKALRKEPARRYDSAGQLAEDVERYLVALPVRAQPDTISYRARKFVRRNRVAVAAGLAVVLLLVAFSANTARQAARIERERERAEGERASAEAALGLLASVFERANPVIVPGGDTVRVLTLLEDGERKVDELDQQPAVQARMWRVLGNTYGARSRYDRARDLLDRSYRTRMEVAGADDSIAAATYHELARMVLAQEGGVAAAALFDTSLSRLRHSLGGAHPDVAHAMQDLAFVTNDTIRRRVLLDSAFEIRRQAGPLDSMTLASSFNARASSLFERGRARDALPLFQEALAILANLLPPEHANRLTVTRNVAAALSANGEYARAETVTRGMIALRERAGMSETVAMATDIEAIALLAANQGRFDDAESGLRDALALFRQLLDPPHASIDNTLRNLGLVVIARGRVVEGLAVLDSAIARVRARDAAASGFMVGQRVPALLRLGRLAEAEQSLAHANALVSATVPAGRPYRLDTEIMAGVVAFARGDAIGAATHFEIALAGSRVLHPATHPRVTGSECGLGTALVTQHRFEEGAPLLRRACPVYERWGLANPLLVQWSRRALQQVS